MDSDSFSYAAVRGIDRRPGGHREEQCRRPEQVMPRAVALVVAVLSHSDQLQHPANLVELATLAVERLDKGDYATVETSSTRATRSPASSSTRSGRAA